MRLSGRWHLQALAARQREIAADLDRLVARHPQAGWDLRELARLDSLGAVLLWRAWGRRLPARIDLRPEQRALFARLAAAAATRGETAAPPADQTAAEESQARRVLSHAVDLVALTGQCVLDLARVAVRPSRLPWRDLSAAVFRTGAQALPITALVGFLVGVVFCYLSGSCSSSAPTCSSSTCWAYLRPNASRPA